LNAAGIELSKREAETPQALNAQHETPKATNAAGVKRAALNVLKF